MKIWKALFSRTSFMILCVLIQAFVSLSIFHWFAEKAAWIDGALRVIGVIILLLIIKNSQHLSSDMVWIILIAVFPVAGAALYLILGANLLSSPTYHSIQQSTIFSRRYYIQDDDLLNKIKKEAPDYAGQFHYLSRYSGYPIYQNTGIRYYPSGESGYPAMLEALKKAEKFIFLEYFIIEKGQMWNGILEVLEEKAKEGLDVRVMYDDLGSFFTLSSSYAKKLEEKGIKCIPFNRINPVLGAVVNHRDHRKIMVVDGKVAFSGGINLADEYINRKKKYGYWKDNVIEVHGHAVWSFTVMFLIHWNALKKEDQTFLSFKTEPEKGRVDGYIAPYGETPLDDEVTSQNIYINILNQSNRYCYIFTPYLIVDTEMINALILAAKRGVDVRIMTPGIPDKKLVYQITRSYYHTLIEGGVKIYEYTPGFVHSKVFVADDKVAVVGTINLDYRSLYLHFENAVYLYGCKVIDDIRDDFTDAVKEAHQVTLRESSYSPLKEFFLSILRLFAPLM